METKLDASAELAIVDDMCKLRDSGLQSPGDRQKLLDLSRSLIAKLEQPADKIFRQQFEPFQNMAIRICIELKLFHLLANSNKPMTASDLSAATGANKDFLARFMRGATSLGFASEVGVETYEANNVTRAMTLPAPEAGFAFVYDVQFQPRGLLNEIVEYFRDTGYQNLGTAVDGPIQRVFDVKSQSAMQIWAQDPVMSHNFNTFMGGVRAARPMWITWFPVKERLLRDASDDGVLWVDVAGGRGQDTQQFLDTFPHVSAQRMVLQDLPHVMKETQALDPGVKRMDYDFFTPQPVHGARIYHFHMILHDWPDSDCVRILKNTAAAMKPGYSRLLINDLVLPDKEVPLIGTQLDLAMLAFVSGKERTVKQWEDLMAQAGLEIVKIWQPEVGEGLVEAVRPEVK